MEKVIKNKDLKISFIFTFIGLIASLIAAMYQMTVLTDSMKQQIISQLGSINALIPVAAVQGVLFTFLATFVGLKLARKVNLKLNFKFDKNAFRLSVLIGFATAFIITVSDRFIFAKYLPTTIIKYVFSPTYFISGILYGGIIEEVLLRLFVMSLIVLIFWKLFAKTKDYLHIPSWVYISAIILSAILFAAGHLPLTIQTLGMSAPILIRCFILNGIGGIGFGYLYWRKGLSYSIYAHAITHIFMQIVFMPILF